MKIFIWNSFGETSVYAFDTEEQMESVKSDLIQVLLNEGSQLSDSPTWKQIMSAIDDQRCSNSDSFEYGTGPSSVIY